MPSATDFLPLFITILMKRAISSLPCLGSGRMTRAGWEPLRDIVFYTWNSSGIRSRPAAAPASALGALRAILGTRLATLGDAGAIEAAAHGVVAHARQVLDAAAADQHHRVLLEVVAFAADVRDDLVTVGQAHLRHLAHRRVRLLRGGGVHAGAHPPTLRAVLQRGRGTLVGFRAARAAHQLVDRCHRSSSPD